MRTGRHATGWTCCDGTLPGSHAIDVAAFRKGTCAPDRPAGRPGAQDGRLKHPPVAAGAPSPAARDTRRRIPSFPRSHGTWNAATAAGVHP